MKHFLFLAFLVVLFPFTLLADFGAACLGVDAGFTRAAMDAFRA